MKKIFFSLVALAALAACSKSEIAYEQTGEIVLSPVTSNTTKSVAGYNGNTFDGIFPTGIDLYVFANAGEAGSAAEQHDEPYFRNAKFKWAAGGSLDSFDHDNNAETSSILTTGAYAGEPTRYWPNVKTLVFAGYSDACNIKANLTDDNDETTPTMNFATNVLTIPAYTQDNATYTAEGVNDLMWFSRTNPYSKQTAEIVTNMKHACSWITVNVKGNDVTKGKWILNSLIVTNIAHKGTAECGEASATWDDNDLDLYDDEDYYNAQTTTTFNPAEGTTFTDQYVEYHEGTANNFIVIPQTPTTLEVTYSYNSDTDIVFSETKSISLDYDGVDETNAAWQSGVHYIYNLTITATEILIDPVVVEWTPNTPEIPAI